MCAFNKNQTAAPDTSTTMTLSTKSTTVGPPAMIWAGTGAGAEEDAPGAGGAGILGISAVCNLTVGFDIAVAEDDDAGMAADEAAVGGGAVAAATVDGTCPTG